MRPGGSCARGDGARKSSYRAGGTDTIIGSLISATKGCAESWATTTQSTSLNVIIIVRSM